MDPQPDTRALRISNLNVLVNAILYNPAATLQVLEAQGVTRKFFEVWFNAVNADGGLPRVHAKKLSILAICALLELDPSAQPPSLHDGWAGILAGILKIFRELPGAIEGSLILSCPCVPSEAWYSARKALFEKHAHEEEDDDEEYSLDDLNLDGDAGAWSYHMI